MTSSLLISSLPCPPGLRSPRPLSLQDPEELDQLSQMAGQLLPGHFEVAGGAELRSQLFRDIALLHSQGHLRAAPAPHHGEALLKRYPPEILTPRPEQFGEPPVFRFP